MYSSSLLDNFASVASVTQKSVSATLLVLAKGNYEIRVEGKNLFVLCIEMQIQIKYINPYPTAFPYGNGMVLHFYQPSAGNIVGGALHHKL